MLLFNPDKLAANSDSGSPVTQRGGIACKKCQ